MFLKSKSKIRNNYRSTTRSGRRNNIKKHWYSFLTGPHKYIWIFLIAFAIIGGGITAYKSFASNGSSRIESTCWVNQRLRRAYCWGDNSSGQLGVGDYTDRWSPTQVPLSNVVSVSVGEEHTCAVRTDESVWCWGQAYSGELGIGTPSQSAFLSPVKAHISNVYQVVASKQFSCALRYDQSVWCWGYSPLGALGNGSTAERDLPVQVPISKVTQISAGLDDVCAKRTDGYLWCWGGNYTAMLGNGNFTNQTRPTPALINNVAQVSLGSIASCASKTDGSLWCWGEGAVTGLGLNPPGAVNHAITRPTQLYFNHTSQISVGDETACASKTDGSLWCWGNDATGQLGVYPVQYGWSFGPINNGFTNTYQIAVGGLFACASQTNGYIWCWGGNLFGELGQGNASSNVYPFRRVRLSWN